MFQGLDAPDHEILEGGAKDCNCNSFNVSKGLDNCGYIGSDFKPNVDKKRYKDLVMECFGKIKNNSLRERLKAPSKNFKGGSILNHRHKERFYKFLQDQDLDINYISSRFIAILFIFTADQRLWKASEDSIRLNGFNFEGICLKEINTDGYALYQTAKTISTDKECIKTNELADRDLIYDYILKAIINVLISIATV